MDIESKNAAILVVTTTTFCTFQALCVYKHLEDVKRRTVFPSTRNDFDWQNEQQVMTFLVWFSVFGTIARGDLFCALRE